METRDPDISVYTEDGQNLRGTVEVNKPLKVNGWKIYQYGYDNARGSQSQYSVFLLVKDPWLPAVYVGIFLMLAGPIVFNPKMTIFIRFNREIKK